MNRESHVMESCHQWLAAASNSGNVREDGAFRCFADAFAQIELHLQRSLIDPLDDTSHMIACAEQRAAELDRWVSQACAGADVANPVQVETVNVVQDSEITPEFREVFIEESEEIVLELKRLADVWALDPQADQVLRDIRRHFHTFKGNGRAVGANILGELGWAAQDLLDRVLDGDFPPGTEIQELVQQVVAALPSLVSSYRNVDEAAIGAVRQLTNRCFLMAKSGGADPAQSGAATGQPLRAPTSLAGASSPPETLSH